MRFLTAIVAVCFLFGCKIIKPTQHTVNTPFLIQTRIFPFAKNNKPNYRIPAIVKAHNGDLLVFAEKRRKSIADVGYTDIVMTRSNDKGATWQSEVLLFGGNNESHADPTTLVDTAEKKIYLFFLRDKKQYYMMSSQNNGLHWTKPISIHNQVVKPTWDTLRNSVNLINSPADSLSKSDDWKRNWHQNYGIGPGNAGIRLSKGSRAGRLLVPARHKEYSKNGTIITATHVFYSDDQGNTWQVGPNVIAEKGSEAQLIELANGDIMVNSRNGDISDSTNIRRRINRSTDGGNTWAQDYLDPNLEEVSCEASIIRLSNTREGGKNRLLFSNPKNSIRSTKHPYGRVNMSVRLSYDEAASWQISKTVYEYTSSYSGLVVLDDQTIGLVYERGKDPSTPYYWDELWFARFNLEWLTDGKDSMKIKKD